MDIWDEIFYAVLDNEVDYSSSSEYTSATASSQPTPSQFVHDLFMSAAKDTALPDLLTAIVKSDWSVPLDSKGCLQCLNAQPGEFRLILENEIGSTSQKKNKKAKRRSGGGSGGNLVPLYPVSEPDEKSGSGMPGAVKFVNGRDLLRIIPAGIDGLLVHFKKQTPFEVRSEHFNLMRTIAGECDLEEIITSPQPGQLDRLLQAKWWVEVDDKGEPEPKRMINNKRVVYARVQEDRLGLSFTKREQMTGEQLFRSVVRNEKAHGLVIDGKLGSPPNDLFDPVFSIECLENMLNGNDIRVGVRPLPARSLEEIELWLNLRRFPGSNRRVLDASHDGETLVRVMVPDGQKWNMTESLGNQCFRSMVWSPVFSLPSPEAKNISGFGEGVSKILCPGLLAWELNAGAFQNGADAEKYWRVGRNLLLGRLLDEMDISMSKKRLKIARELQKLIPEGMNTIPRSRMRTVEGAAFIEEHPHGATRDWIEETVRQAERFTKTWVPN